MNAEAWRDIPGYEGLYQISSFGRLKSFKQGQHGKILSLTNKKGDYFRVVLQGIDKPRKSISIHRLVAEAFIPNPHNLPQVNHKDGNKQNNAAENLEWCSCSFNLKHARRMHPDMVDAMRHYNRFERPIPILQISKDGEVVNRFQSGAEAARHTGICKRDILLAAQGADNGRGYKRKSAGGFIWQYERKVIQK